MADAAPSTSFWHLLGRSSSVWTFETTPALPATLWLALGIAIPLLPTACGLPLAGTLPAALAATILFFRCLNRPCRRQAWLLPFAAALTAMHLAAPWQTYQKLLPRLRSHAEIQAVVTDSGYAHGPLPWLIQQNQVMVRIRAIRTRTSNGWQPAQGKILLDLPEATPPPPYGTVVRAKGTMAPPTQRLIPGEFDYGQYLWTRGVRNLMRVKKLQIVSATAGWHRLPAALFRLRERCAENIVDKLRSDDNARVAVAMTLGYRQGLTPQLRESFLRSGAVHMFAISGLHVGIAAMIMGILLKLVRIPYRWRYALLPLVLSAYVFMTGAAPSAVRALIMIAIWALAKATLRPASPLNAVALAALALLCWNPLYCLQTGFLFSFVIVLVLVLGWRRGAAWSNVLQERRYWRSMRKRHRRLDLGRHLQLRVLQMSLCSGLAWLGSAALVARTNSLFVPAGILVNIGISTLAGMAIATAGLKMMLAGLQVNWLNTATAAVLDLVLAGIRLVVDLGGRYPGSMAIVQPPMAMVLAAYFALLLLLLPQLPRKWRLMAGLLLLGTITLTVTGVGQTSPPLAALYGDDNPLPVIICESDNNRQPMVINTGFSRMAGRTAEYLQRRGVNRIAVMLLPDKAGTSKTGLERFLTKFHRCDTILASPEIHDKYLTAELPQGRRGKLREIAEAAEHEMNEEKFTRLHLPRRTVYTALTQTPRKPDRLELVWPKPSELKLTLVKDSRLGGVLKITDANGTEREERFPFRLQPELRLIPVADF